MSKTPLCVHFTEEQKARVLCQGNIYSSISGFGDLFVCLFLIFHLRLRRKTAGEQVCQTRVCIFSGTSGFLEAYCHIQETSLAVWTTASELLERHPASGPSLSSLFLFCTHHKSLQCYQSVVPSEQLQLLHRKTLSVLAAEHVPGTAICPRCCQHGSSKKSQGAGLLAIISLYHRNPRQDKTRWVFNPISTLKQSRSILLCMCVLVCRSPVEGRLSKPSSSKCGVGWSISWVLWGKTGRLLTPHQGKGSGVSSTLAGCRQLRRGERSYKCPKKGAHLSWEGVSS